MRDQRQLVPARSYLYVPGDRPDRFSKASTSGAGAVILDLEDGVSQSQKRLAHAAVSAHPRDDCVQWWVRLDPQYLEEGLGAAVQSGTSGVVVPTVETSLLRELGEILDRLESERGFRSLGVIGLIETARGVADVRQIAANRRVHRLGIGEADLAADLGMTPDLDRKELWAIRSDVVVASAVAQIAAPIGPVFTNIDDDAGLERSTALLVRQGFAARTLIHPRQVSVVHRALTPTVEAVAHATDVIEAFDGAMREGVGLAVDRHGGLIDLAVVRSARMILSRANHSSNNTSDPSSS